LFNKKLITVIEICDKINIADNTEILNMKILHKKLRTH